MPHYTVTSPDGSEYQVDAPDGATKDQAIKYVQGELAAGRLKSKTKGAVTGSPAPRSPAPRSAPSESYMDPMSQAAQDATADSNLLRTLKPDFAAHPLDTIRDITAGIDIPYRAVGNAVMDATGSPVAAAGAYTLSQALSPAIGVKLAQRAVRLGKIAATQAEDFAKLLSRRIAEEGKTGWNPTAKVTDERIEQIAKELTKGQEPSKAIKTQDQKIGAKKRIPAGEEGFPPEAANLDDIPHREPTIQTEPPIAPQSEPKLETLPDVEQVPEQKPIGNKPVKPMRETVERVKGAVEAALEGPEPGSIFNAQTEGFGDKVKRGVEAYKASKPNPQVYRRRNQINYNNDSLLTAIKKLGGLDSTHALDITGEKGFRASTGNVGLWKKGGMSIDDMATQLAEHGYLPPEAARDVDGGVQWLREAVRGEIDGQKVYSMYGDESVIYGRMRDEGGKIDPHLVTRIASTSTGAVVGAGLDPDNPVHGALIGAAGGFGVGHIVSRRVISGGFGSALKVADNPGKVLHDAKEAEIAAAQRGASQVYEQLRAAKVAPERGFTVIRAIETGDDSLLLPQEKLVAQLFRQEVGKLGSNAQEAGLIKNLRKNYAPLIFDWSDSKTAATLRKLGAEDPSKGERTSGFSTFTPFQLERTIDDYGMAQRLGLKPKTTDPAELYRLYASSVIRATENKRALTELANLKGPDQKPLVGLKGTVPGDFEPINKGDVKVPELEGFMVHPDIAASVRAGLTSYDPSIIARSAQNVSWFAKRFNVSLSAFHPMALLQAHAGAGGNPFDVAAGAAARGVEKLTGKTIPYESAVDQALSAYKNGGAGDAVDTLIRNGLKIEAPLEDRSGRGAFQATAKLIADKADSLVPGGGLLPKGASAVDSGLQKFTWDYLYTGLKISTGMKMLEQEVQRNMVAAAAGKEPLKPINQIAADVSSFVNSTYGGLNLRRIAEDVAKQWGKDSKMAGAAYMIASPRGQAYTQMAVFAPDWKMSTLQAWTRGLGITGNETVQRFHREYLVRSAFMSLVLEDAVNVSMSGHHVWQNDFHTKRGHKQTPLEAVHDATYVDLGDGRKMQMFKHFMEGPHAIADPQKFALNALGYIPRTAAEIAQNREFLTPDWAPKIVEGDVSTPEKWYRYGLHAIKRALPIASYNLDSGVDTSLGGFFGTPIYGSTPEQKQERARQRMEEKARALGNK